MTLSSQKPRKYVARQFSSRSGKMNYDRILGYLGEFGPYQRRTCFLISLISIPIAIHGTTIVFQTFSPPFRCAVPDLLNDTFHIQDDHHLRLVKTHIPVDEDTGQFSQCSTYDRGGHSNQSVGTNTTQLKSCTRWVYDHSEIGTSITTEYNFVCGREMYKAHLSMMIMMGILVGSLFGGPMADFFGRKKVIVVSLCLLCAMGVVFAFANSVPLLLAIRFVTSFAGVTCFITIFVLLTEVVGPTRRTLATMGSMFGWCVGLFLLVVIQYFVRDWRTAQLVQTVPFFIFVVYWWVLQESPRWLLIRGKLSQAEKIISYIAKVNQVQLPQELEPITSFANIDADSHEHGDTGPKQLKVWHMCSRPMLAVRVVILAICWSTINMVYYGLVLGVGDLIDGNIYINFTLQSAMELVGNAVCLFAMERVGRKKLFCTSIILAGLSCLCISITIIVEADIHWVSAMLFSVGKFGITLAFTLIYIVTAELLPTVVRNSGVGFCSFAGRIAGVISPYIASASQMMSGPVGQAFPVLLFGILSLVSGLLSLWLPETRNRKLPETIEDADNFQKLEHKDTAKGRDERGIL